MASDFELSVYDVLALSRSVAAETDLIGALARDVRASSVERGDFGADEQDGVGAAYVRLVRESLVDALLDLRTAGDRVAAGLTEMTRRYESADEHVRTVFDALAQTPAEG